MRHRLNLRKYPRGLPQRLQRVYARTENFGFRAAFAISDFFAIRFALRTLYFVLCSDQVLGAKHKEQSSKYKVR
jgi:hypothetical protein